MTLTAASRHAATSFARTVRRLSGGAVRRVDGVGTSSECTADVIVLLVLALHL